MKKILVITITLILSAFSAVAVRAYEKESGAAAHFSELTVDNRVQKLSQYLTSVDSPMSQETSTIIIEADELGIDWKLIPAIAGVESYFGKRIPANSFNAWGWAIFTGKNDGRYFNSWKEGIAVVSHGIKEKYFNRGLDTIYKMGPVYAADEFWAWKVQFFMDEIESFKPTTSEQLDILL